MSQVSCTPMLLNNSILQAIFLLLLKIA
uniref:Uncharacterized protein n=1 Tax=Rhizophora mucronata TaxID=61149 RepID=A0A2P2QQ18_RHIMU